MTPFLVNTFEKLHEELCGYFANPGSEREELALFQKLRDNKEVLLNPYQSITPRDAACGYQELTDHVKSTRSNENLYFLAQKGEQNFFQRFIPALDEVSNKLKLHQHHACILVERAIAM